MESRSISFFSEGVRLAGDLFLPGDLKHGETRAGIVLCHGYTGVRNLYLPDIARVLTEAGYVVLTFDYKGWGDSEGPKSRLAPYSRVIDVAGGADLARRAGHGGCRAAGHLRHELWRRDGGLGGRGRSAGEMRGLRGRRRQRPALDAQRAAARRVSRSARTIRGGSGQARDGGTFGIRRAHRHPDPRSPVGGTGRGGAARQSGAVSQIPLEFVDDTLGFNAEWVVDRIAPRPVLFITTDNDRLVPPEESEAMYRRAGEPKKLVMLHGFGHYEVYTGEAFRQVMEPTVAWFQQEPRPQRVN